ncbi:hypothetical protein C2E23DRAFT_840918 [Lenzites betulinus]|nr:hypothetical protein C2E23DRAFT_840918 [Lenzites betulinus]
MLRRAVFCGCTDRGRTNAARDGRAFLQIFCVRRLRYTMAPNTNTTPVVADLDAFFPLPSAVHSPPFPARVPGVTPASGAALVKTLKDNHVKWHAFFNERGFHNHASHHLVAIYGLGASGPLIEAAYQTHVAYMRPAVESPESLDEKSVWTHLGKENFYSAYLEYFRAQLREKDVTEVVEEYIFSARANIGEGTPRMLSRFFAALIHPMIHMGCGLEFGFLGLVAEGLAQAAVHTPQGDGLYPDTLFEQQPKDAAVARLTALLPSLSLRKDSAHGRAAEGKAGVHAFTILARILADDKYSAASLGLSPNTASNFQSVTTKFGSTIADFAAEWAAELEGEGATPEAFAKKIEELAWVNALLYGVGGWAGRDRSPSKTFNADFFYMHLVTSSLFLSSYVAYLSPRSSVVLLRGYFAISITWFVTLGRCALPIREFYAKTTDMPTPPAAAAAAAGVAPAKGTLTPEVVAPNPWLPIIQTTIAHPGEHVCKLQRALAHNATAYGTREAGFFANTGLEGAEILDSTLFIRAAGLTADRVGWMKEGQAEPEGQWDRAGFNY